MQILTREEENFNSLDKDEVHVDVEQATTKFVDIARQLEAFFLQKRFLLSVLKPELIVKEVSLNFRIRVVIYITCVLYFVISKFT